jgi:hypothetical protein
MANLRRSIQGGFSLILLSAVAPFILRIVGRSPPADVEIGSKSKNIDSAKLSYRHRIKVWNSCAVCTKEVLSGRACSLEMQAGVSHHSRLRSNFRLLREAPLAELI